MLRSANIYSGLGNYYGFGNTVPAGLVLSLLQPNRFGLNRPAARWKAKANFRRRSVLGVTKILETQCKPKWITILLHPHGILETPPGFVGVQIEALPIFGTVDTVFCLHLDAWGVAAHHACSSLPLKYSNPSVQ